jgi:16S rRNA C967 or C1407 C5-methylase (RsmB/RsmF family)
MISSPFDRYRGLLPEAEWGAFTRALERPEPRTLRVRMGRTSPADLHSALEAQGFACTSVDGLPGVLRVDHEPFPLSETLEHWLGLFYIQQAVTCLAAPALAPRPGEGVLDLCAAPGGKTSHLAELMEDRGCVVAAELSEPRARALVGNLSRLAHPIGIPVVSDALLLPESAPFHRVLADVPCSGEGRSRRDGPVVASEGDLRRLPALQEALLRKALRMLVPGGRVLYVTCTLAPEENEAVVDRVLRQPEEGGGGSPEARLVPLFPGVPHSRGLARFQEMRFLPELEGAVRLYPHHLDSGGLFMALLERADGEQPGAPVPDDNPSNPDPVPLQGWGPLPKEMPGGGRPSDGAPRRAQGAGRGRGLAEAGSDGRPEKVAARAARGGRRHRAPRGAAPSGPPPGEMVEQALEALRDLVGPGEAEGPGLQWMVRGEGVRFHRIPLAPLVSWEAAGEMPRILAVGLRGFEVDRKGRLSPSGDLLRWLGPELARGGTILDDATWVRLLDGARIPAPGPDRGTVLFRGTHPLAPARIRGGRLLHDVPTGRARWLRQVLARG